MNERIGSLASFQHDHGDLPKRIGECCDQSGKTIVVLDDDPTGTQTVYETRVLTVWDTESLTKELNRGDRLFYILTNSRALTEPAAIELAREIGCNLQEAAKASGSEVTVISRSDSTLRGHYPAEVDSLGEAVGMADAVQVLMPFFLQGRRFTIDDTHYVADGDRLIPAAETPFAKDATFGFSKSELHQWVAEKRVGWAEKPTGSLSINDLRTSSIEGLTERLVDQPRDSVLIVNAASIEDARVFALAAHGAENRGQRMLYRTAASFVQAFAGLTEQPLLLGGEVVPVDRPAGLVIVGSYVPKSTEQLQHLLACQEAPNAVELSASALLRSDAAEHVRDAVAKVNRHLAAGEDVVVYTSRDLITGSDADSSLEIGGQISTAIVELVRSVTHPLRFLIAKGGITSSDVATKGLEIEQARVSGQILPGIPVWVAEERPEDSRFPYIVFPGNVGAPEDLMRVYLALKSK
ncbi:MAG: four-carbon acid sugar kinase family protein [Planctomycetota bacterium]